MKTQGFFLLRRPLLSREILLGFHNAAANTPGLFEFYLKIIYSDPLLQQAIHLASPGLHEQALKLIDGELENGKEKVLQTLYKYLIRMSTRCTPFGLFAGYAVGEVTDKNLNPYTVHTRLDSEPLMSISDSVVKNEAILNSSRFYPNSSLYKTMDSYRYMERQTGATNGFVLSEVGSSRYLNLILESAKKGPTICELVEVLKGNKVSRRNANIFINSLIEARILISGLEMNATGDDYLLRLKRETKSIKGFHTELERLTTIDTLLKQDSDLITTYKRIYPLFDSSSSSTPTRHLVQTDLCFKTENCEISHVAVDIITSDLKQLLPLTQKIRNADLTQFASRLFKRFGSKELSLLACLDEATGIGYGTLNPAGVSELPLLEGLGAAPEKEPVTQLDSAFTLFYKQTLDRAKKDCLKIVELSSEQIVLPSDGDLKTYPESFYLFGSIIAASENSLTQGEFKFDLQAMAGPSGLNLLARFAVGNPDLETRLREATQKEQNLAPEVIFAEICHIPDTRSLNVIKRPALHNYEIPYLATSCVEPPFQIQPSELMVSSPDGMQIILTCPRLGKRIIPRLTSAHNYNNGLPVYRFLCDLAHQSNGGYLNWEWPQIPDENFFPRITFKHLILQKAQWRIDRKVGDKLLGDTEQVLAFWSDICQQRDIPRYVQIQQGDNALLIDGLSIFSLQLLGAYLKKSSTNTLIEYLPGEKPGFLSEAGRSIDHEIIIPFINLDTRKKLRADVLVDHSEPVCYNLGSEWLYVKIYCSTQAADFLLTKIIYPFCETLLEKGTIQSWFYIRYFDPEGHLRIRLNLGPKKKLWSKVLKKFQLKIERFIASGLITAIKTDCYEREMERYGFLSYSKLESLFWIDSTCCCECLTLLSENKDSNLKWLLALRGCNQLMEDIGLSNFEKSEVIKELHIQFTEEFHKYRTGIIILDKKYRNFKQLIGSILDPELNDHASKRILECFQQRTTCGRQVLDGCEELSRKTLKELAVNMVHLFLNRWFAAEQRRQEWVLYHFLKKYYDTVLNFSQTRKNNLQ
jgi:thiopeptide-type bacteriocin biosynthesis protein